MRSVRCVCPDEAVKKTRVSKKIGQKFVIVHMTCPQCQKVVQFLVLIREST